MNKQVFRLLFFLTIAAGTGYFLYNRYRVAPEIVFSEIKAIALDGSKIDFIADGQSNTIVLFFATWCIDCRRELPVLQSHSALLNKLNTKVYLISDEDINTLTPFSTRLEAPFQLLKLEGSFKESGIYTLPTAFLYCKDGSIHLNKTGAIDWTEGYLRSFEQACK